MLTHNKKFSRLHRSSFDQKRRGVHSRSMYEFFCQSNKIKKRHKKNVIYFTLEISKI